MARALAAAALALLASCGPVGDDGYPHSTAPLERTTTTVTVVPYPSLEALREEAARRGIGFDDENDREGHGFGIVRGDRCEVHVLDPRRDRTFFGHEVLHCLDPDWHG